jgi:FHA domain
MFPMGMDPMQNAAQTEGGPQNGDPSAVQGVCSQCGRPLPPPDLEAVAISIDQMLSMESGRAVARSEWAGGAPDGLLDSLLTWMPSVKARRSIWTRGQELWAEQMTAALSGPCDDCRANYGSPAATAMLSTTPEEPEAQTAAMYAPPVAPPASQEGRDAPTPAFGSRSVEPSHEVKDLPTAAMMSRYHQPAPSDDEPAELPTMALSSSGLGEAPPAEPAASQSTQSSEPTEEYEAHTVMIPAVPRVSGGPRLMVLEGPVHGHQFSVERQTTTIGRSIGCHITIDADRVGYDHARVVRDPNGWRLEVVGGATDTYVNDEPVSGPRSLRTGDVIRIGPARLRFEAAG